MGVTVEEWKKEEEDLIHRSDSRETLFLDFLGFEIFLLEMKMVKIELMLEKVICFYFIL